MFKKRFWPAVCLTILFFSACFLAGQANEKPRTTDRHESSQFLRLLRDERQQPAALESAIVRYVPRDRRLKSPVVDLITAVHIGEKKYYEQLNREFAGYDAVLYELVAPEGTRVPKGGANSDSLISTVQKALKNLLELEFQLETIDYTRANLVHADMSPAQFAESMNKRGETIFSIFIRMFTAAMAQQNSQSITATDAQLLMALFDKDRAMTLKRIMAEQFQSIDGMLSTFDGPNGSTLVSERNKKALEVLREQIGQGKKKLAIFYGAGHMPDFDKRLRQEFGLVPVSTRWLVAWELKRPSPPAPKKP
jgi:hypothetical protein